MPVIAGTNSWVTIAEADTYLSTKWGASDWATLNNITEKTPLLISAFNFLRRQTGYEIDPASTDQAVKDAQCETAWFLYRHSDEWNKRSALYASGVRSFDVMSWSEDLEAPDLPKYIKDMLTDYATGNGNYISRVTRPY